MTIRGGGEFAMTAAIVCPRCGQAMGYVPALEGQAVACPACGMQFVMTAGVEPVPQEGFAVWVAKLRPMLLQ